MPPKQRNIRKKRTLEEEEAADGEAAEGEVEKAALEDLKLLHKQRKRTAGIHSSALAASRADEDDLAEQDNELMESYVKAQGGAAIMTEEQHMERYVEQEVARRLGKSVDDLQGAPSAQEREELALYEVPEELKVRRPGPRKERRCLQGARGPTAPAPLAAAAGAEAGRGGRVPRARSAAHALRARPTQARLTQPRLPPGAPPTAGGA
jgi:hypothetical protein